MLTAVDLVATLVFALEGALAALAGGLDVFGLMVLAFATALGGGIICDLLIGDIPPNSIRDWRYGAVALAGGAVVFFLHQVVERIPPDVLIVLDAAGLSLFAVAGTEKALAHKINSFSAALMGTVTGVGGGKIRDVLLAQVPTVLRADVYATAVLAGSVVLIICRRREIGYGAAAAGWRGLLHLTRGQRLAALESAARRLLLSR